MILVCIGHYKSNSLNTVLKNGVAQLFPEQVDHWHQRAQDTNTMLEMEEQRDFKVRHQQDQKEIKAIKQDLGRKEKTFVEAAALMIAAKKIQAIWSEDGDN